MKTFYKKFSTLIVPEIVGSKRLHSSVFNLITASNQLDKDVNILLYGSEKISDELINQAKTLKGVNKIYTFSNKNLNFDEPSAEHLSSLVSSIHKISPFSYILASSNNFGKNFLPRVGGMLDVQPLSEVAKIEEGNIFSRYFYAGNALCKLESPQKTNIMTIRLTSFDQTTEKNSNSNPEVVDVTSNSDINNSLQSVRSSKFVENLVSKSDKTELTQAKVVIAGGRALKSKENFKLLEDLASCFSNSALGASRAAVDAGYVPNDWQVGQTGKTVAPEIYFAIGISGAIQHVAGMKDSKVIVSINSDPDSPIFNISTYGLVGDLFKIIPELTEKIKKEKTNA